MKKILIIEDNQALSLAYQKKFSHSGYQVDHAEEGQTGIRKANDFKPDIIILDIMLPGGMNGFDILKKLKQSDETKSIPVLVMTNLSEQGEAAKEVGATEYLLKVKVSLEELVQKVDSYLK